VAIYLCMIHFGTQ